MKNYIGIALALVVVAIFLFISPAGIRAPKGDEGLSLPPLAFPSSTPILPSLTLPGINNSSVSKEAFAVFNTYREYARTNNLEGVKSLSHQISPACSDPARVKECENLMASVYYFTQDFKEEDFNHVYYDDRQIVMFTDFLSRPESPDSEPVRNVLFFTRNSGSPKLLGIKFCLPDDKKHENCFQTDPAKRDLNNNGWWDQVESFFR